MRHFLALALAPSTLAGGMKLRAVGRELVAYAGAAQRRAPPAPRARLRAVDVATITAPADPHLAPAALAVEQPAIVLEHRDPRRRGLDIRRVSRHKGAADQLTSSTAPRRPGGSSKDPGPSLISATPRQDIASRRPRRSRRSTPSPVAHESPHSTPWPRRVQHSPRSQALSAWNGFFTIYARISVPIDSAALRVPPRATRLSQARGAICMRSLSLQARL